LDEKIPSPEVTMAKLYYEAKDRVAADEWMQKAIARAPKDPKTRLELGQFYMETGRIKEAKAQADEAVKLAPDMADALLLAGVANRYSRDYPKAVNYLEKAYLKSPGNLLVSNQLALAQVEMGEEPARRAMVLAESVMKQNPNNAEAAATLGWIYFNIGRMDEAERMLRAAVSSANVQPDTAYYYAKLQDYRNRGDLAKPLLDQALKSEAPFANREEAQKLADQLNKRAPAATPSETAAKKGATPTSASKSTGAAEAPKTGPSKSTPKADSPKAESPKTGPKPPAPKQ
jgi:tetratricopeptide (TPR) repeat protein